MGSVKVERIDHLGIVAGVIQDLGIIEMMDSRIVLDEREEISTGEAVAGMIINGLGFSDRPISLTPQFFQGKALDILIREGITPDMLNRFKLGRSLDKVFSYGCDLLFSEIALSVCKQEEVDLRFNSLDTTSFSLTGEYAPDSDEHTILVTHGYSKDHRPCSHSEGACSIGRTTVSGSRLQAVYVRECTQPGSSSLHHPDTRESEGSRGSD